MSNVLVFPKLKKDKQISYDILMKEIKAIATAAKRHDTGERQYRATDYEYIMSICERILKGESENYYG